MGHNENWVTRQMQSVKNEAKNWPDWRKEEAQTRFATEADVSSSNSPEASYSHSAPQGASEDKQATQK